MRACVAAVEERPIMTRIWPALVGFSAVIGQIVLLREVICAFNGNELSLGIVLGMWLLWTALGSGIVARLLKSSAYLRLAIALVSCLCGGSLIPTIVAIRYARGFLQVVPGELVGPGHMYLVVLMSLSVFCMLAGCMFALAARLYQEAASTESYLASSYAYLYETVGAAVGGVLTSILLLRFVSSFTIAFLVALLNGCIALALLVNRRVWRVGVIACFVALAGSLTRYAAPQLEEGTQRHMWSGFELAGHRDSAYGRLAVLSNGETRTIYEDGGVVANVPDRAAAEETVHLALLEHPQPCRLLLIGGGLNGSIAEALKHPSVESIDYVELDPALIEVARQYLPAEMTRLLSDPRIRLHAVDGRLFLNSTAELFDEIIVSIPDPDNAQLNRFYTAEFFRLARTHLQPGGVLALELRSSEETIGSELGDFLRCIRKTLQSQFPYVAVIPGETLHLFGSEKRDVLTEDPQVLGERLRSRQIQSLYVRAYSLQFRLAHDRMAEIRRTLQASPETPINHDAHPVAYYFGTILWSAQFNSIEARAMKFLARISFSVILTGTAILLAPLVWMLCRATQRIVSAWSVLVTGYALMAMQILLLLSFQSMYGYVYRELAALIGAFMGGIALGCWFGIRTARSCESGAVARRLQLNQLAVAFSAPLLLLAVKLMTHVSSVAGQMVEARVVFPLLALLMGIPGGYQFPIATKLFLHRRSESSHLGTLYALDLVGGCVGAVLLAGFLIPLFGFWNNAWLCLVATGAPAAILLFAGRSHTIA